MSKIERLLLPGPSDVVTVAGGMGPFHQVFASYGITDTDFRESGISGSVHYDCGDAKLRTGKPDFWVDYARDYDFIGVDRLKSVESHNARIFEFSHPFMSGNVVLRCIDKRYTGSYDFTRGNLRKLVERFGEFVKLDPNLCREIFMYLSAGTEEALRVLVG